MPYITGLQYLSGTELIEYIVIWYDFRCERKILKFHHESGLIWVCRANIFWKICIPLSQHLNSGQVSQQDLWEWIQTPDLREGGRDLRKEGLCNEWREFWREALPSSDLFCWALLSSPVYSEKSFFQAVTKGWEFSWHQQERFRNQVKCSGLIIWPNNSCSGTDRIVSM